MGRGRHHLLHSKFFHHSLTVPPTSFIPHHMTDVPACLAQRRRPAAAAWDHAPFVLLVLSPACINIIMPPSSRLLLPVPSPAPSPLLPHLDCYHPPHVPVQAPPPPRLAPLLLRHLLLPLLLTPRPPHHRHRPRGLWEMGTPHPPRSFSRPNPDATRDQGIGATFLSKGFPQ